MSAFRIHYEALEAPRFLGGERHSVDLVANTPDAARRLLPSRFERLHPGCKPLIHKIKRLKEATR